MRRPAARNRSPRAGIALDLQQPRREPDRVLDVDEVPVRAVDDEVGRLPGAGRDEGHAGRHRLEHALRPALLTRRDDVCVERVVRGGQAVAVGQQAVHERHAATLELARARSRVPGP